MATTEELQAQITALSARVAAITAPPTDYYTSQYDGEEIDAAVGRALPGGEIDLSLSDKQYFEFLDNTDFTNPVAQAGIGGLHGSVAYAVDRWKLISGTVSWDSNGLTLNGTIRQIREFSIGFPAVPSIEMHSGTASITYDDTTKYCDITSSGGTIKRPHLGLREITDWTKVSKQSRERQLFACQYYYQKTASDIHHPCGATPGAIIPGFLFPRKMRTFPVIKIFNLEGTGGKISIWGAASSADVEDAPARADGILYIRCSESKTWVNGVAAFGYEAITDL